MGNGVERAFDPDFVLGWVFAGAGVVLSAVALRAVKAANKYPVETG